MANPQHATILGAESGSNESPDIGAMQQKHITPPLGTCLLIPPQRGDYAPDSGRGQRRSRNVQLQATGLSQNRRKHWIACVITSRLYGRSVSPPDIIIENTRLAVRDLKRQLAELQRARGAEACANSDNSDNRPGELWSCRFNSGLFAVAWAESRKVLEESGLQVTVVRPLDQ
jgi:ADP-ribose 1''-phosphate phosphatase